MRSGGKIEGRAAVLARIRAVKDVQLAMADQISGDYGGNAPAYISETERINEILLRRVVELEERAEARLVDRRP